MDKVETHVVFTDGSCYESIGSWTYVEVTNDGIDGELISRDSGYVYDTTNNRMEMMAIIKAIEHFPWGSKIKLFSDSGYCVDGHNNPSYLKKWVHNGWKTSKKQPVENKDLWERILTLDNFYDIRYVRIKGHSKDKTDPHKKWNDMCDSICTDTRLSATNK